MNPDTATVEELWRLLAEKLPGLREKCKCICHVTWKHVLGRAHSIRACPSTGCTGTVTVAPSMERMMEELRKWMRISSGHDLHVEFSPVFGTVLIKCILTETTSFHEPAFGTGLTDLEALCRAAAKALRDVQQTATLLNPDPKVSARQINKRGKQIEKQPRCDRGYRPSVGERGPFPNQEVKP